MGGFFGAISKRDVTLDIFFGVDYHSHLGTRRGGMVDLRRQGRLSAADPQHRKHPLPHQV